MTPKEYSRITEDGIYGFFGDYAFLSNFHEAEVWFEGRKYRSAENAYQAAKILDSETRHQFEGIRPIDAKKTGRHVDIRPDWDHIKYGVMMSIVFDKFHRHRELGDKLVATGGKYLEETNHWGDDIWGVDYRSDLGRNWLGMILMDIRRCQRSLRQVEVAIDLEKSAKEALNVSAVATWKKNEAQ